MLLAVSVLPDELIADRTFLEVRFPRRFVFLDRVGQLADELESGFPEADILPTEIKLRSPDRDVEVVLAPERIWVRGGRPTAAPEVASLLDQAVGVATKHLELDSVDFVGARQVFILPVGGVSEATSIFRKTFFDYRAGPLLAFGDDPTEAQAIVAYRVDGGVCRVQATAVAWTPRGKEGTGGIGAVLLDVDRVDNRGNEVWAVTKLVEDLLADGRARAVRFVTALQGLAAPADG